MDGVSAFSTIGTDITSSVSIEIKNGSGNIVSQSDVVSTPGAYLITYTVKDVFGSTKSSNVSLTIT